MTNKRKQKNEDNSDIMSDKESPEAHEQANETPKETVIVEESPAEELISAEQRLTNELEAANDKYIRLYAEFDNYKRRTAKERIEQLQSAGKEVIANLLPVLDDFDRALKAMETTVEVSAVKEGVLLVSQKLKKILTQQGLKEMDVIGKPFDAELQEAITSIPAPDEDFKGKVLDEIEKGYYLHDKVLRHAKVVIGN